MSSLHSPATIKILQVSVVLRLFECVFKILLYFGNRFEVVRNLEALHVLDDPSQFVIFIEVKELLLGC